MIARRSFGGAISTQAAIGMLAILVTVGLALAIYNIKKLQIDQHRAWMLRTMFWLGTIITARIIIFFSAVALWIIGDYYSLIRCDELKFLYGAGTSAVQQRYPECFDGSAVHDRTIIKAEMFVSMEGAGAALRLSFGMGVSV